MSGPYRRNMTDLLYYPREQTPQLYALRSALGENPDALAGLSRILTEAYMEGFAACSSPGEIASLREFLWRIESLPPGATLEDVKRLAREALEK